MSTQVDNADLWTLLLSTVRYAFNRQSYITQLSCELVLKYQSALTNGQLAQIAKEISEEITRHRKLGKPLEAESIWMASAVKIHNALVELQPETPISGIKYKEELLQQIAAGVNKHDNATCWTIKVTFVTDDNKYDFSLAHALDVLASDLYWDERGNWSTARIAHVNVM